MELAFPMMIRKRCFNSFIEVVMKKHWHNKLKAEVDNIGYDGANELWIENEIKQVIE